MSSYTGQVTPGGPAQTRTLDQLSITKVAVDEKMSNNCYLLRCTKTGEQLLVDAAAEPRVLLDLVGDGGLAAVVTTHQHWDHHRALADVVAVHAPRTAAGEADADGLPVPPDVLLRHGDTVRVGELALDVVGLRGHTPGSVALALTDGAGTVHLLTGDSLFPGGPGKTSSPEDFASLMDDLEQRVFAVYPDGTHVHPGHGDSTTLGQERPHLAQWRERGW